jgi:hypothetical protein
MKNTLITFCMLLSFGLFAQSTEVPQEVVIKTLLDQTHTATLTIEKDTFIPNIMGYGCPVAAINVDRFFFYFSRVRRTLYSDFGVKEEALTIHNPSGRFCTGWASAGKIFGPEYVFGKQVQLEVRTVREIVETEDFNGNTYTKIKEVVSTELFGEKLSAIGELFL